MIEPFLLEILACPRCESRPKVDLRGEMLVCSECGWGYRIIEGIPQMLVEEAVEPSVVEKEVGGK
ncbi:MAG: hypothetical protein U0R49_10160 [Fimbriimonadales bacterium]